MSLTPLPPHAPPTSWYEHLLRDKVIVLSWIVFLFGGVSGGSSASPYASPEDRTLQFIAAGYAFWALYFGWAGCVRVLVRIAWRVLPLGAAIGFLYLAGAAVVFLAVGAVYSWLGGGVYEFVTRLRSLIQGQTPPFLGPPRRVDKMHEQLTQIEELWKSGRISRQEYDRLRYNTMRRL